ncbi:MAG: hypothetical protein WD896_00450 [Parcubacteria group bacterium]
MTKHSVLYIALALVVILGALHFFAEAFYFYWTIWWFDTMMHLLAGICGGLILVRFTWPLAPLHRAVFVLVGVLVVGISWEVFEYVFDIANAIDYWSDTLIDLVADMTGAIVAYWYVNARIPGSS